MQSDRSRRRAVHVSGVTSFNFVNFNLALTRLRSIATTGLSEYIDPVLDRSAPVPRGRFAAEIRDDEKKDKSSIPRRIPLREAALRE